MTVAAGNHEALRGELRAALAANAERLRAGLRAELALPHPEQPDRPLQFEVDPCWWDISSCATEEAIFAGECLEKELPGDWFERAEAEKINTDSLLVDKLCPWFVGCWQAVGGPASFAPAYLFLHDYHHRQYHLEECRWVPAAEVFGK